MKKFKANPLWLLLLMFLCLGLGLKQPLLVFAESEETKTAVFFGDSITQNFEAEGQSYPDIVGEKLGFKVINLGFGGSSLSSHPAPQFDQFSFAVLSQAIVKQDFSKQKEALAGEEIPAYFEEKLNKLEAIDFNEVDLVFLMYGANDWGKPIDNDDDTYDRKTYKGAGRSAIETLQKKYPHLDIVLISPIYRYWPDYDNRDSETSVNSLGLKPRNYSQAMIDLAKEYHLPYVDAYFSLGINSLNRQYYFNENDGTHPNDIGTKKLAQLIVKTVESYGLGE